MTTTHDLFIQPKNFSFEKTALEVLLPEDSERWPHELLQELFKQVPYVADFEPNIQMDRVDPDQGYALGSVVLGNKTEAGVSASAQSKDTAGIRSVRLPILIKDRRLYPLDILVSEGQKILPLTESRLRTALFRPQIFDVTGNTPGDQSMVGQLYPPYRQNFGFGAGGVLPEKTAAAAFEAWIVADPKEAKQKTASMADDIERWTKEAKAGRWGKRHTAGDHVEGAIQSFIDKCASARQNGESLLSAILPTVSAGDHQAFQDFCQQHQEYLPKNAAALLPAVEQILQTAPAPVVKTASLYALISPTVTQLVRQPGAQYLVKTAHPSFWAPEERIVGRGEALAQWGAKVVLAADTAGQVTLQEGEGSQPAEGGLPPVPVTDAGMYVVQSDDGQELTGAVIPGLIDVDGTSLPIALFTNGQHYSVQADIVGAKAGDAEPNLPTSPTPSGTGFFFGLGPKGLEATVPLTIQGSFQGPQTEGQQQWEARSFDGTPVQVTLQPTLQKVQGVDGQMLVPDSWQWSSLDGAQSTSLQSMERVESEPEPEAKTAHVVVRGSRGSYTFEGAPVEKIAADERSFLSQDRAQFLLAALGTAPEYGAKKLAEASINAYPVRIAVSHQLIPRWAQEAQALEKAAATLTRQPKLSRRLWKEATELMDPTTVDTVLSLGFINPDNVMTFVGYLPQLEESQQKLCELLLAARIGLSNVSPSALERAVRATEEVLEGLKALAFKSS